MPASASARSTTAGRAARWARLASSGTTPPNTWCTSCDKITSPASSGRRRSPTSTAAEVSSHDVSIPRTTSATPGLASEGDGIRHGVRHDAGRCAHGEAGGAPRGGPAPPGRPPPHAVARERIYPRFGAPPPHPPPPPPEHEPPETPPPPRESPTPRAAPHRRREGVGNDLADHAREGAELEDLAPFARNDHGHAPGLLAHRAPGRDADGEAHGEGLRQRLLRGDRHVQHGGEETGRELDRPVPHEQLREASADAHLSSLIQEPADEGFVDGAVPLGGPDHL